jgi:methylaspartate mutase epsilon subunit
MTGPTWSFERLDEVRATLRSDSDGLVGDLQEAVGRHAAMPALHRAEFVLRRSRELGRGVVEASYGGSTVSLEIEALRRLEESGADILTIDAEAGGRSAGDVRTALDAKRRAALGVTDGFPVTVHGSAGVAEVASTLRRACGIRLSAPDARAVIDAAVGAGVTYVATSALSALAENPEADPADVIDHHRYVDRLLAYYAEQGVPVVKEIPASGVHLSPGVAIARTLIGARLAAEQGVRHLVVSHALLGNLVQDVAGLVVLRELSGSWLLPHASGATVSVAGAEWRGTLPSDEGAGYGIVLNGAIAAALGGSDLVVTSPVRRGADVDAMVSGARTTRQLLDMLTEQHLAEGPELEAETSAVRQEAVAVLEALDAAAVPDFGGAVVQGLRTGALTASTPVARDAAGRVRPSADVLAQTATAAPALSDLDDLFAPLPRMTEKGLLTPAWVDWAPTDEAAVEVMT